MDKIIQTIENEAYKFKGIVGVGFKDLKSGREYYYNGDRRFYMASTFKIIVLIAFFDCVMNGVLKEDDIYTIKDNDYLEDTNFVHKLYPRRDFKLIELATLMMILSDNTSTDILWNLIGEEKISSTVEALKLKNTKISKNCRKIIDGYYELLDTDTPEEKVKKIVNWKYNDQVDDKDNVTTPRDMTHVLSLIYNNEILNEKYCEKIMDIMRTCLLNNRIPSYLPSDAYVAHKTGTIDGYTNDIGIVFTSKGDYILTFYCTSEPVMKISRSIHGEEFLARLSRSIYDLYTGEAS